MKIDSSIVVTDGPVLVTGGAGSIGSNLVKRLLELGCCVTILDDLSSGNLANLPESSRLTVITGSVTDDASLARAFTNAPVYIFHLAAQFANQNSVDQPFTDLLTNAGGTVKVLEMARRVVNLRRVIIVSSSCVYGSTAGIISEDTPVQPMTPYAISKLASENYGMFYHRFYDLSVTILRYFNTYGPGEQPGPYRNVIPNFFHRALQGLPLLITGTGNETRTFTYVRDIVAGTIQAALAKETVGQVFNLGSQNEVRIVELAKLINQLTGNPAGIELSAHRTWDEVIRRAVSCEKARQVFGYNPEVSLVEGLEHTYRWFLSEQEAQRL